MVPQPPPPPSPWTYLGYAATVLEAIIIIFLLIKSTGKAPSSGLINRVWCKLRRFFRRWSWLLLFVPGLLLYPVQQTFLLNWVISKDPNPDRDQAWAAASAKVVDAVQIYSKMSLALGVFCLINLLAWAALNMVMPVLPDWAKGDYREPVAGYPAQPGFKGTFLRLPDGVRIGVYFLFFALEIYAAATAIEHAFRIQ
jgi:hypothetical protein